MRNYNTTQIKKREIFYTTTSTLSTKEAAPKPTYGRPSSPTKKKISSRKLGMSETQKVANKAKANATLRDELKAIINNNAQS
jgi:hypothetical protein